MPTGWTIVKTKMHALRYFINLSEFCSRKYGFGVETSNPLKNVYFVEFCDVLTVWLEKLQKWDMNPLCLIEESFESSMQKPQEILRQKRQRFYYSHMKETKTVQEILKQGNWKQSRSIKLNPIGLVSRDVGIFIGKCVLFASEYFQMTSQANNGLVSETIIGCSLSLATRRTIHHWINSATRAAHGYFTSGGFLVFEKILYQCKTKTMSKDDIARLPQHSIAPTITMQNLSVICLCGTCSISGTLFQFHTPQNLCTKVLASIKKVEPKVFENARAEKVLLTPAIWSNALTIAKQQEHISKFSTVEKRFNYWCVM